MPGYAANGSQTVNPGASVLFNITVKGCPLGLIRHFDGEGDFLLSGKTRNRGGSCPCRCKKTTEYFIDFAANVGVEEGGTPGPVSLALARNGVVIPYTTMTVTPAEAGTLDNISRAVNVPIWLGCCQSVAVVNTGTDPIVVNNPTIEIDWTEKGGA